MNIDIFISCTMIKTRGDINVDYEWMLYDGFPASVSIFKKRLENLVVKMSVDRKYNGSFVKLYTKYYSYGHKLRRFKFGCKRRIRCESSSVSFRVTISALERHGEILVNEFGMQYGLRSSYDVHPNSDNVT